MVQAFPWRNSPISSNRSSAQRGPGTGLGLAVSRKILREHGGDILVTSQIGTGSRFVLRTPLKSSLALDLSKTSVDILLPPFADE